MTTTRKIMTAIVKAPIVLYRYTFSAFAGRECRYLPTCSEYAQEAIERHGPWKGLWLTLARLCRCNPWGPSGLDPVPDMQNEEHPWWAPWRYGRWSGRHMAADLDNKR